MSHRRTSHSANTDHAAHSGSMMFHHVAMEQPQAWIVSNEHKIGGFTRGHQIGVTKHIQLNISKLARIHPEMLAMKMHRMFPAGVIANPQNGSLAKRQVGKHMVIPANHAVKSP